MTKFLFFLVFLNVHALYSAPSNQNDNEIQRILKKGEIAAAIMSDDRWPFFYSKDGDVQGIDAEIVKRFAKSLGVKAKITRNTPGFISTLDSVAKNEVDLAISAFYPTVERATQVRFTLPYCNLHGTFVSKRITQIKNLKKIVGTFDQTLFASSLEDRFPASKIIGFHKRIDLWAALKEGKIDTLYADDLEIQKTKKENKDFDLYYKVQADNESSFPVSIALNLKSTQLAELLNLWIRNEESTGSLKRLCSLGAK